ncbi:anthranilate synthase component 1 [Neocucurbitaria cava]|uniref:Anthranilate synthase component 1 n=1 Tax=Neocucurbitaria cava TaxID=798079 RepID=A0A9W8Y642_9PLEO|nr:anthranilate synthase component 1 [Neocucurbitaria cava]
MLVKDGIAYLQAGGGIVFDSDPYDEWMETINKLAEEKHLAEQTDQTDGEGEEQSGQKAGSLNGDAETRISFAAG